MTSTQQEEHRILIVDDLASARKVVTRLLGKKGYHSFVEASNGAEALELLKKQKFDLIISDWEMPNLNGLDLLRYVREDGELKRLPFIMMTAIAEREGVVGAVHAGVTHYLMKPFDSGSLYKAVEAAFGHVAEPESARH